ncbi:2Fe-2S iron-sulfur cluster-binding protein [Sulfitobacter sp. PR48]|jgi:2Fe-2S ferredoxin|uniref:2Fe-2S iron-sulfur cluster-binding protein n=1 Tax=Sulfitobacter sp. PR48 TaxID=3028383 RepID=UPI00237B6E84|nr:2Fe-2S iron-sulfur cluster-binding protein [Sulfitobacter sp. PR48]MDD9721071.1 2Fe-2S iron-sulfur cluster-binding protein [Sulfitobacter sp. PR48]
MPKLHFTLPSGDKKTVEAPSGISVMQAARDAGIEDILADCGGAMACATCHVFVDPETFRTLDAHSDAEDDMLDFAATERSETSRLSCQITVTPEMDGAHFTVPVEI